jgi:hypothetical protein
MVDKKRMDKLREININLIKWYAEEFEEDYNDDLLEASKILKGWIGNKTVEYNKSLEVKK